VDAALPWLDEHRALPFFAWLHFYDPHAPYDAPEPFRSRLAGAPYAAEIAYTDWQVGRILTWLDTRGLADRTVVLVVGDHGESLDEHGESLHGLFVYNATTRVPLIVRTPYPGTRGRRVPGVVRGEDVMPTVLELVGRTAPPDVQGRSLVPMMTGETRDLDLDAYSESYYPRNHYGWSELRALRSGRYKFIQTTRPELYDIERDPQERVNLYHERRELADRFARALAQLAGDEPAAAPSDVDPETRERLAALGYIGSFTAPVAKSGTELADAKDKIEIFNLLTAPRADGRIGSDQAIARLRKVTALDPGVLDAWIMLGNEYVKRGELQTALAQYQRALALNPTFDLATINLANTYRSLGNHDAAILGYRRYLENDPRNALVRYQLGEVHLDLGQLDDAQDAFRQALVDDMRVASARNALGVVAFKRGDLVTAEREIRAALAQKPDVRLAHFNLALIAEQRGDPRTAMEEYQKEIDTQPGAFKAAFNLAKLQEQLGNRPAQEAAFRKALELNPRFAEGYFYLAKQLLDEGRQFDEAITLARAGLEIAPESSYAPLGHYVLADIYSRRGDRAASDREAARGRDMERRMKVTRSAKVKPQGS
jgi:tetratricopeptide (TPR) repeat protein